MDAFTYKYLQSVDQSVSVLSCYAVSSDGAFKRKCLMEKLFHLKRIGTEAHVDLWFL